MTMRYHFNPFSEAPLLRTEKKLLPSNNLSLLMHSRRDNAAHNWIDRAANEHNDTRQHNGCINQPARDTRRENPKRRLRRSAPEIKNLHFVVVPDTNPALGSL